MQNYGRNPDPERRQADPEIQAIWQVIQNDGRQAEKIQAGRQAGR